MAQLPIDQLRTSKESSAIKLSGDAERVFGEIERWCGHHDARPALERQRTGTAAGYRALFDGAGGPGKALAATRLGNQVKRDVFRVDLSKAISNHAGETEKNLSLLFDRAEQNNWILFFDEADALFGKRSSVQDSHDRFANQDVSYLLQRIESYHGIVILATHQQPDSDDELRRRMQAVVHFPMTMAML